MRSFLGLVKRNLLIYFKDIQAVIFSLLTSIIVFALYLLFLKGTFVNSINSVTGGLEGFISEGAIDMFVSGLLLTGVLGSAMITVPFNCLQTIVKDRETRIDYDISATPVKRGVIVLSYLVAAIISSIVMTGLILTVGLIIIGAKGDMHMSASELAGAYGVVVLGSVSASTLFMIVVLFFKSSSAAGAFFGILSAAAGFVIGAYIPISEFSPSVQTFCNLFPASHVTILLREKVLGGVVASIDKSLNGIDGGLFAKTIKETFSFNASMFSKSLTEANMVAYIMVIAVVCVGVMVALYSKVYKRK